MSVICQKAFTLEVLSDVLYKIPDYGSVMTPLFTPNPIAVASSAPEWDGTFRSVDVIFPDCFQFAPPASIQGKAIRQQADGNQIRICVNVGLNKCFLDIDADIAPTPPLFDIIWQGQLAGVNPVGVYTYITGFDTRATVEIVAGP